MKRKLFQTTVMLLGLTLGTSCKQSPYIDPEIPNKRDTSRLVVNMLKRIVHDDQEESVYIYGNDLIVDTILMTGPSPSYHAFQWNERGQIKSLNDVYILPDTSFECHFVYDNQHRVKRVQYIDRFEEYYYNSESLVDYIIHSSGDSTDLIHSSLRLDMKNYTKEWRTLKKQGVPEATLPEVTVGYYKLEGNTLYSNKCKVESNPDWSYTYHAVTTFTDDLLPYPINEHHGQDLWQPAWIRNAMRYMPSKEEDLVTGVADTYKTEKDIFGRIVKIKCEGPQGSGIDMLYY